MKTIQAAYSLTRALTEGGFTEWLSSEIPTDSGFCVADGRQGIKLRADSAPGELLEAIQDLGRLALLEGFDGIGGWVSDGLLYLDPVTFVTDRHEAVNLGRSRGELAIFNQETSTVLDLTSGHKDTNGTDLLLEQPKA